LCEKYPKLFDLCFENLVIVAAIFFMGCWLWRRNLFRWKEESTSECRFLLANVSLQINVYD
jgi:hypothetical protein